VPFIANLGIEAAIRNGVFHFFQQCLDTVNLAELPVAEEKIYRVRVKLRRFMRQLILRNELLQFTSALDISWSAILRYHKYFI